MWLVCGDGWRVLCCSAEELREDYDTNVVFTAQSESGWTSHVQTEEACDGSWGLRASLSTLVI